MSNYRDQYFVNAEMSAERRDDKAYFRRDLITSKWKPVKQTKAMEFCSNFSDHLRADNLGHISHYHEPSRNGYSLYTLMPSAMWLYRLACVFKPIVKFDGPEGYKFVWSAAFKHTRTGTLILFYEWKGGFAFGAIDKEGCVVPTNPEFLHDVVSLLNFLTSEDCCHPYDGVVAGSVA